MDKFSIKSPIGDLPAKEIDVESKITVSAISDFYYYRYSPSITPYHGESHNFFEFFASIMGEMVVEIENKRFYLKENQYILVPKNVFHKMFPNGCYASSMSVNFDASGIDENLTAGKVGVLNEDQIFYLNKIATIYTNNYRNDGYFQMAVAYSPMKNQYAHDQEIKNCIENLLISTTQYFLGQESSMVGESIADESQRKIANDVKSFLLEHYMDDIKLKEIAEAMNYSVPYICKIFKICFKTSINNYINIIRISEAMKLIESSEMNLEEISGKVGFDSLSYFSKVFKKYTGFSPKTFSMTSRKTHLLNASFIMSEYIK